ncbi:Zn-dependent peptidase [Alteracholeplasma palmae J233]|uniref:Zn-dependent peptidase n=1 Tax=Alteracholeplasma palmae (strain ATCC 49389 / J233) TaxID=1318466 RepID=U4KL31_ALTPJ|nr:pitrilysin family protein [Alteracholeplasma palmae]CCV64452.1 Zn-dependent peptidase [Alteracholeplasma palmae J233]
MLTINHNHTFKTIQIVFWYNEVLNEKTIAYRFLLGKLLRYYTDESKTAKKLNEEFSYLYGARLSEGVKMFKGNHYLYYCLTIANADIVNEPNLLLEALKLYQKIVYNRQRFDNKNVNIVKKQLLELIEKRKEDKSEIAKLGYYNKVFSNHIFGKDLIGTKEEVSEITSEKLYDYYQNSFLNNELTITINGDISESDEAFIRNNFPIAKDLPKPNLELETFVKNTEIQLHEEYTKMHQALIYIGYFSDITYDSKNYEAMVLMYILLGSSPDSRLFRIIREQMMLAYEVDAEYDIDRKLLTVYAGVELSKKELAQEKILDIMENLIQYGPTVSELDSAKKYLKSVMYTSQDYQLSQTFREFLNLFFTENKTLEEKIKKIDAVTINDVKEVLNGLELTGIYILHGDDENEE